MGRIHTEASTVIDARSEEVYAIFADYRGEHRKILPEQYFSNLEVEKGGNGAGTVFRVRTHVFGSQRDFHMEVAEPEPGRVLTETDLPTGLVTTFTVTPEKDGKQTKVRIATDWEESRGINGFMDRVFTPRIMRRIYNAQLEQLKSYLHSKH
jgi:hypothetical protein